MNRKKIITEFIEFRVTGIDKLSLNKWNVTHWGQKTPWKNRLKGLVRDQTDNLQLEGGYELDFNFFFLGRALDKINTSHYAKIIEDQIFTQDQNNGKVSLFTNRIKEGENYVDVILRREVIDEID